MGSRSGARNQQTGRAGEYFVAAELCRRGAYAVTFAGNMPRIDILASNVARTRTVQIQIKTRRAGKWQTSIREGESRPIEDDGTRFWIFVDLSRTMELCPVYYVVPEAWIRRDIWETHQAYLARHGGSRARNPDATHHSIDEKRIAEWKGRWELLQLF